MEKAAKPGRSLKSHLIKEYTDRLKGFSCLFVLDFGGTKNKEVEDLRRKLKTVSGDYIVVKNSLCKLALEKLKVTGVSDMVTSACGISYGKGDPVSVSKVLVNFSKNNKALKIRCGYLEGNVITPTYINELAALPPREVLLARLLSCMNSPISGFVGICSGVVKKFVYALNEIAKKRTDSV